MEMEDSPPNNSMLLIKGIGDVGKEEPKKY